MFGLFFSRAAEAELPSGVPAFKITVWGFALFFLVCFFSLANSKPNQPGVSDQQPDTVSLAAMLAIAGVVLLGAYGTGRLAEGRAVTIDDVGKAEDPDKKIYF